LNKLTEASDDGTQFHPLDFYLDKVIKNGKVLEIIASLLMKQELFTFCWWPNYYHNFRRTNAKHCT